MNGNPHELNLVLAVMLRPAVLPIAALLGLRLFGIRHPASQHAVWTAVLVGILILVPLAAFGPHFNLAVLPASDPPAPVPVRETAAPLAVVPAGNPPARLERPGNIAAGNDVEPASIEGTTTPQAPSTPASIV